MEKAEMKKTICLLFMFMFVFIASCAPILVPQSGDPTRIFDPTQFPSATLSATVTFTATATPTKFPPDFTPSPIPTMKLELPEQRCSQAPAQQNEFNLPAPSELKWEVVNTLQRLTGLMSPIYSVYPSPAGRWWMIELVSKWNQASFDYLGQTALYVLDSKGNQHWVASENANNSLHRFDWFSDGRLIWVEAGQLFVADADGQNKQTIQVPEPVLEVWLDKTTGSYAFVSGKTALWRLDLKNSTWDRVKGLESLSKGIVSPISRDQANLRISQDGTFGAILADHLVWKVPMAFGEPAKKLGEVEYLEEGWRVDAPQPLADSPYWYPGRDSYDPKSFGTGYASMVLIDERDGSLLSLADIVPKDFGNFLRLQISPDTRWIAISNGENYYNVAIYILSTNQLTNGKVNGRVITDVGSVLDWDITEVQSSYPGRVNHPDSAFMLRGDIISGTGALDQLDLVSGEMQTVKELPYNGSIPIFQMTWIKNTPILLENAVIERIAEDGTFQSIGKLPEFRPEDYPDLVIGGPTNQVLLTAQVNKSIDDTCRVFYYLFIANLDNIK